ncbi:MAG: hypothetical protein ACE5G3_02365 [Gammaproteobacteria bacterium]
MRVLVVAVLVMLAGVAAARNENIGGFREAVISVAEFDPHLRFYRGVAGWEIVERGAADPGFAEFWSLDTVEPIQQVLLRNPGSNTGYVRLVRFPAGPRQLIRSNDRPWDTGGIFDLNLRVAI